MSQQASAAAPFRFDPKVSTKDNIDRFCAHLKQRDAELGNLFEQQIGKMLPLPTDAQNRAARRSTFNAAIVAVLDAAAGKP